MNTSITSRTWLNIGLVALVVVLAIVAFYLPGLSKPAPPEPLTPLKTGQITSIHIGRMGQPDITLRKDSRGWNMTQPLQLPANLKRVGILLDLAERPSLASYPAKDMTLEQVHLASTVLSLKLNDVDMIFGDVDPLNQRRYVRIGQTVHLIEDKDFRNLLGITTAYASLALLPPDSEPLEIDMPKVKLIKQADGHWHTRPLIPDATEELVKNMVEAWRTVEAEDIKPYDKRPATMGKIQIRLKDEWVRFEVVGVTGDKKGQKIIMARPDRGVQYTIPVPVMDVLVDLSLLKPPKPLQLTQPPANPAPDQPVPGAKPATDKAAAIKPSQGSLSQPVPPSTAPPVEDAAAKPQ